MKHPISRNLLRGRKALGIKSASGQRGWRVGADARRTQIAIIGVKFLSANTVGDPDWNPNENLANFVCSKNRARCSSNHTFAQNTKLSTASAGRCGSPSAVRDTASTPGAQ